MDVRLANDSDLDTIYAMGYDAWADGAPVQTYLESCRASEKYKLGTWYVLSHEGNVVSSLIVYSSGEDFDIPAGYRGIGSVATEQHHRKNGYASLLINTVCAILEQEDVQGVYLHADVGPSFYEGLGFSVLSESEEPCMVRMLSETAMVPTQMPYYF